MENPYLAVKQENLRRALDIIEGRKSDGTVPAKPALLHLEITTRCNLRCLKCGHATDPPGSARIAPRHLQYKIIETCDEYFASAVRVHTFGYGEMFLYGKLQMLVERLKHHGCMVDGITNGVLVGEKEVDWLVEYGFDEITFSIDGVEPATMQRLRGVDVEPIWKTLAYIKARKLATGKDRPRVVVNFVAQSDNYHELPDLVRKLADKDIYFMGVNPLFAMDSPYPDAYVLLYRQFSLRNVPRPNVEAAVEEAAKLAQEAGIAFASYMDLDSIYAEVPAELVQVAAPPQAAAPAEVAIPTNGSVAAPSEKLAPYYCAYPWTSMYLHADTGARVCCFMEGSMGVVNHGDDLRKVWTEGTINEIRDAVAAGEVHRACKMCVRDGRYRHSFIDLRDVKAAVGLNPIEVAAVPEEPVTVPAAV